MIKKKIAFLLLGSIAVYLCMNFSKDWLYYQFLFNQKYGVKSWTEMFDLMTPFTEALYFMPAKAVGELIGFSLFVLFTTLILLLFKLNYLSKIVGNTLIATFFYVCLYLFLFEGTVLRVTYSTAFIIAAMYYLKNDRLFFSILLFLIATQIHLTSFVFILMYPLFFFRRLNWLILVLFLLSPMAIILEMSAFELIVNMSKLLTDKYTFYAREKFVLKQNSSGLYYYFIGFFYTVTIATGYYLKQQIIIDPFKRMIFSLAMIGVTSMCLFYDHVAVGARLGELLLITMVILLSWLHLEFKEKGLNNHSAFIIVIFIFYGLARFVYLFPTLVF